MVQNYKFSELIRTKLQNGLEKVIHKFSSDHLNQTEISLFVKGLNLSLPPHSFNFENHLLPFELLYRDVINGEKKYHDAVVHSKSKLKDISIVQQKRLLFWKLKMKMKSF